jgi:hypothetical protein
MRSFRLYPIWHFSRDLDKVVVLSYLLGRYVPGAGVETIPGWLSRPSEEPSKKSCFLSFFEDDDLKSSLNWFEIQKAQNGAILNVFRKGQNRAGPKMRRARISKSR